ncbi:MATE family efflux transporter [Antarcticibacterium flavum]|uniref:Multidrug-efflux transporter n=1 Tax=Antarcticibacterium flavum TaxID=2058175 RepID=A0A5B7X1V8_9FLAO|nr:MULTISPECIES: MATE family efflux transporter [Antarcticibacterium]MCM4160243.1 MATE family efflux transporter [Antarcticibacterium sp. W02-3]QCY68682.1 MATE family efflux transporter [Antarcticibacterium flavum]
MKAPLKNKYTEGKILNSLISLALPIIFANILQTTYQLIDTFWLGRLGANAVAAVSLSFPLLFLVLSLGSGLTLAGTVMVAQYKGAENQKMVDFSSSQSVFLILIISAILALISFYSAGPLMRIIGAGPEIYDDSVAYFKVSSLGFVFLFLFFIFQSLMRGIGNVMLPVYVILFTVFLNLILDPLFIYGYGPVPGFGVAGAAVASVVTQGLSALIGLVILFRGKSGIKINVNSMRINMENLKRTFNIGFPASIEQSTRALGMTMMVILVTSFGSDIVAAYGIGARILSFIVIPALGLAIATTSLVGQNIGARKIKRAEKVANLSNKVAFFGLTGMGLLLFIFAEPLTAFFIPNDPEVIQDGALFIKIMAPSFGLLGVQQVTNGVFNGAGFTKASMLISILSLWIVRFPLAYVLSYNTSLSYEGIWWAFPISNLIAAIAAFSYFKMGYWKMRAFRYRN